MLAMALWLLTSSIIQTAGPASRHTKPLRLMPVAATVSVEHCPPSAPSTDTPAPAHRGQPTACGAG
ncbi:MAG: hypothetical protein C4K60_02350 [Ideonella sp. MAG2]|nr:MAG: hypothetical protein C4K60_02350 [Ideonella sp. MAG2]